MNWGSQLSVFPASSVDRQVPWRPWSVRLQRRMSKRVVLRRGGPQQGARRGAAERLRHLEEPAAAIPGFTLRSDDHRMPAGAVVGAFENRALARGPTLAIRRPWAPSATPRAGRTRCLARGWLLPVWAARWRQRSRPSATTSTQGPSPKVPAAGTGQEAQRSGRACGSRRSASECKRLRCRSRSILEPQMACAMARNTLLPWLHLQGGLSP